MIEFLDIDFASLNFSLQMFFFETNSVYLRYLSYLCIIHKEVQVHLGKND